MQNSVNKPILFFKTLITLVFGYFFWLMLQLTLDYIPAKTDVSFLMIKQTEVISHKEYLPIFYSHVYSSIFVLMAGFLSIFVGSSSKYKKLHRFSGKTYILLLLFFAAPSGIYMGFYANGSVFAKISFIILGIFWWFATFKAYLEIKNKKYRNHKIWMYRSFALAISAITLRIWKVVLVYFFQPNPMDVYEIIAWLGWIPNILVVEYLILKKIL